MVLKKRPVGFAPTIFALARRRFTTQLWPHASRFCLRRVALRDAPVHIRVPYYSAKTERLEEAASGICTRDPLVGNEVLFY